MKKKNTLLYLDEELVDSAKRLGVNLSEIAEAALKYEVSLRKTRFDPQKALMEAKKTYVPLQIKRLKVQELGPIKDFSTECEQITIITGSNGSGKSTLLGAIHELFTSPEQKKGLVVETKGDISSGEGCVLIDDFLDKVPEEYHTKTILLAKKQYAQVIFTSSKTHYWDFISEMDKRHFVVAEIPTKEKNLRDLHKLQYITQQEIKRLEIRQKRLSEEIQKSKR